MKFHFALFSFTLSDIERTHVEGELSGVLECRKGDCCSSPALMSLVHGQGIFIYNI